MNQWVQRSVRLVGVEHPLKGRWFSHSGRDELSSIASEIHQPVFHHQQGKNIQLRPSIRFRGGKHGFGVIQSGKPDSDTDSLVLDLFTKE